MVYIIVIARSYIHVYNYINFSPTGKWVYTCTCTSVHAYMDMCIYRTCTCIMCFIFRGENCLHVLARYSKESAAHIFSMLMVTAPGFPIDVQDREGNTGPSIHMQRGTQQYSTVEPLAQNTPNKGHLCIKDAHRVAIKF